MQDFGEQIAQYDKILIGIGSEWKEAEALKEQAACRVLAGFLKDQDYFVITDRMDGRILKSALAPNRITAPCGNMEWRQCSKGCTKDIWEPGEIPEDICPHCGAPLTGNTILADPYIEEGYLPQWNHYTQWLGQTLNHRLLVVELGVGFERPSLIRWPMEKTVLVNRQARLLRIHEFLYQVPVELKDRAEGIGKNSVTWILEQAGGKS